MIKKNILGFLLLLSVFCLFNSCEDDPYYDERYDLTSALCSGTWAENYRTNSGEECYHELNFYSDWTGSDYYAFYRNGFFVRETREIFRWYWDDDNYYYPNSIYMDFPDGTYSYFEDIQIRGFQLRGILDDVDVILELQ
jgi:hypothetical protein